MSKWINKKLFEDYVNEKQKDDMSKSVKRSDIVWPTPTPGTSDKPQIYEGRFLPDPNGKFTIRYFYHGYKILDKFRSYLCPKTWDKDNFCLTCLLTSKLYMGNNTDKELASKYKRKSRNIGNWYIVNDPRDQQNEKKYGKTVKIYEFPDKVDSKIKAEITDKKNGLGYAIFDPGEDGFDFILKVKTTKPDSRGNTWPDYSDSIFARKPYALGKTDAEIKSIMESTYNLTEYLKGMEISDEELINILKVEMVWELVESDYMRINNIAPKKIVSPSVGNPPKAEAPAVDEDVEDFDDVSEEDLLKELEMMGAK